MCTYSSRRNCKEGREGKKDATAPRISLRNANCQQPSTMSEIADNNIVHSYKMSTDYVDGFLRYDAFPQNTFAARDLPVRNIRVCADFEVPVFKRSHEIRGGNTKAVRSIAWSCDGRRVATGTEMKGLRIWEAHPRSGSSHAVTIDPSSSSPLPSSSKTPSPHNGHVAALAWSPTDPKVLVSACKGASGGGVVVVWDVTKPTSPLASFKIGGDILHLAFHPSGHHFAAVCPRSIRDEVFFFRLKDNNWEQRSDVMMGGAGIDIGVEEVSFRHGRGADIRSIRCDSGLEAMRCCRFRTTDRSQRGSILLRKERRSWFPRQSSTSMSGLRRRAD